MGKGKVQPSEEFLTLSLKCSKSLKKRADAVHAKLGVQAVARGDKVPTFSEALRTVFVAGLEVLEASGK